MRKFNVTVNGTVYEVEVEEVAADTASAAAPAAVKTAPATVKTAAPATPAAPKAAVSGTPVKAPMQGTIVKVVAKVGDSLKKGDLVCVIEAMKMETDIYAPADGKVSAILVRNGDAVKTDDVIVTLG